MKTRVRLAGGSYQRPEDQILWRGELSLIQGAITGMKLTLVKGDKSVVFKVSEVCLELAEDDANQVIYVVPVKAQ